MKQARQTERSKLTPQSEELATMQDYSYGNKEKDGKGQQQPSDKVEARSREKSSADTGKG